MTANTQGFIRRTAAATAVLVALGLTAAAPAALAQDKEAMGSTEKVTAKVTIKSINPGTRHITVSTASGDTFSLKVPPEVHNFSTLKVGDTIHATYTREVEYVLSRNAPLPPDAEAAVAARAAKGELPAGVVANHIVVTGAVIGIDLANHTLKIVSPQGGEVYNVSVKSKAGRAAMAQMKNGDKITAYVTESMMISASS
jgi:hypothetical protein